jgi:MFS family permease
MPELRRGGPDVTVGARPGAREMPAPARPPAAPRAAAWLGAVRGEAGRVLVATFVTLGLAYGFWYAYSVFLVAFLREFGWSRSVVAGAFSVLVLVHGLTGPTLGWLVERFGARAVIATGGSVLAASLFVAAHISAVWHLYAALGVLAAVGVSAAGWVPSVVLVRAWYPAQIGTALGLVSTGIGFGIFALVPFAQLLIDALGWRWALRVLGAIMAAWIVPATLLLVRDARAPAGAAAPASGSPPVPARRHWTLEAAVRSWRFWATGVVFFAGSAATQMLLVHQVAFLVDHGVSALVGATVVGIVGVSSIAGKAGWGTLSDRVGREPTYSLAFGCVAASVGLLALAGAHPATLLPYAYAAVIGIGYAVTAPLTPAIASDLFGGPQFARIFGALHFMNSVGGAVGAWVAGSIFDATHSYALALPIAAGMALLAPGLLWIVAPRRPNPPP